MKKIISYIAAMALTTFIISFQSCAKKEVEPQTNDCKTCKAFATSTKPEASEQVCTTEAEQSFRSKHTEQEISCR